MPLVQRGRVCAWTALAVLLGWEGPFVAAQAPARNYAPAGIAQSASGPRPAAGSVSPPSAQRTSQPVYHVARQQTQAQVPMRLERIDDPFAGQSELNLDQLVAEVLARNRSLAALQAAWRAAAEKYPQAISLADPTFMSLMAPGSFNDPNFQSSFMVGASQQLPWAGKRRLRGDVARAETNAASMDANDLAVRIAATTRATFFDYYLARRQLDLLRENERRLREFRDVARAKYEAKSANQQDMLQADVELAELTRQRIEFERDANVTVARINTLLHRLPNVPLPPPPREIAKPISLPEAPMLYQVALSRRPDLAAIGARLRAEQAQFELARREFYPDFEVGGRYDQFWDRVNQRGQIGINMNVPLYQDRRYAAMREANWKICQRRAEFDQQVDSIRNDVQAAFEQVNASREIFALYDDRVLPTIDQNIKAARTAYETGQVAFLSLIEAQRQLIDAQMKRAEALADYHRKLAELEQAIAGPVPIEEVPAAAQ
jgi:outer membrane protein, heavy metal efflux system